MTDPSTLLTWTILILAIWRVTHLIVVDEIPIIKKPRDAMIRFFDPTADDIAKGLATPRPRGTWEKAIAYLLDCPWCMSMWVGPPMIWLTSLWVSVPLPWLLWLAASGIVGWLGSAEALQERRYELVKAREEAQKAANKIGQ